MGNPTEATFSARDTKKFYLVKLQFKKYCNLCYEKFGLKGFREVTFQLKLHGGTVFEKLILWIFYDCRIN